MMVMKKMKNKKIDNLLMEDQSDNFVDNTDLQEKASYKRKGLKGFIIFLILIVLLMMVFFFWSLSHKKNVEIPRRQNEVTRNDKIIPKKPIPSSETTHVPPSPPPSTPVDPIQKYTDKNLNQVNEKPELTPEQKAMLRRLGHDFDSIKSNNQNLYDNKQPVKNNASSGLAGKIKASDADRVYANKFIHPDLTIAKGSIIPCGTLNEINTTQEGFLSCMVSKDVYSANGKVALINKGAIVDGEIVGQLKRGQNRIMVVWSRVRNPDNVIVNISSIASGTLGASGLSGSVNNHFWSRFGNSMLISVLSDGMSGGLQIASNLTSKKNTASISMNNTSQNSNELSQEILQQEMNIPPTLYKQQGADVLIYVARDLDFSKVYELESR